MIARLRLTPQYFLSLAIVTASQPPSGQGLVCRALENFQRTGDRNALVSSMTAIADNDFDAKVEIPALVQVLSSNSDAFLREIARSETCVLAFWSSDVDAFRPAENTFEKHLDEMEKDENSKWLGPILILHSRFGLQPNSRVLAIIYKTTTHKDGYYQSLAFQALARVRPLPMEVKELFRSRLPRRPGLTSGPEMLSILAFALPDPDVVQIFAESAEGADPKAQRLATQVLGQMSPLPKAAIDVFERLNRRDDLDEGVRANVRSAIERIGKDKN